MYAAESINVGMITQFANNQPTLELLEGKTGIFSLIDDAITNRSQTNLLNGITSRYGGGKNDSFLQPKPKDCKDFANCFGVAHYAGNVYCNVQHFLEKNASDSLQVEVLEVLRTSKNDVLMRMFESISTVKQPSLKKSSIGLQFRTQMADLLNTINAGDLHFVRCIKPNDRKLPRIFDSSRVLEQLKSAGLVDVCRIRKLGYPIRFTFSQFFKQYRCIAPQCANLSMLLEFMTASKILSEGDWVSGKSLVLLRSHQLRALESAKEKALYSVAVILQKSIRRYNAQRKFKLYQRILNDITQSIKKRQDTSLSKAIELSTELPYQGESNALVKEGRSVLTRLAEEKRVTDLLESAMWSHDISSLKESVLEAHSLSPPLSSSTVDAAREMLKELELKKQIRLDLSSAVASEKREFVLEKIAAAQALSVDCIELTEAESFVARLDKEKFLVDSITTALSNGDVSEISNRYSRCAEFGLAPTMPLMEQAKRFIENKRDVKKEDLLQSIEENRLSQIESVKSSLGSAIESCSITRLSAAIIGASEIGVSIKEVDEAKVLLANWKSMEECKNNLQSAIAVVQTKLASGIVTSDLQNLKLAIDLSIKVCK